MKISTAIAAARSLRPSRTGGSFRAPWSIRRCANAAGAAATAAALLALAGCAADGGGAAQPCVTEAAPPRILPTLVLAAPLPQGEDDATGAETLALAGRLDRDMGAKRPDAVVWDVTDTWILDQQFTWNGRPYDNYVNQQVMRRRTVR